MSPPLEVWESLVRLFSRRYLGSTLGEHVLSSLQVVIGGTCSDHRADKNNLARMRRLSRGDQS